MYLLLYRYCTLRYYTTAVAAPRLLVKFNVSLITDISITSVTAHYRNEFSSRGGTARVHTQHAHAHINKSVKHVDALTIAHPVAGVSA